MARKLSKTQWQDVRAFIESGGDRKDAAKQWGVTANAIDQRAFREKWRTKKRVLEEVLVEEAKIMAKSATAEEALEMISRAGKGELTFEAEKIAQLRREVPSRLAEGLAPKLIRSITNLKDPGNWKEFGSALSAFCNLIGLNKSGVTISMQGGMDWSSSAPKGEKPIIIEAETV